MKRIVSIFLLTVSTCLSICTHPGRTDSAGGHFDKSTGEYHYHHGYPAHQHENGVCPYNYGDKTDRFSSSSSLSGTVKITKEKPTSAQEKEESKSIISSMIASAYNLALDLTMIFFGFLFACCLVIGLVVKPLREFIKKLKSKKGR